MLRWNMASKRSNPRDLSITAPKSGDALAKALTALPEDDLTSQVIVPLVNALHPGRIEYTHSPVEAGRDIVSYGRDALGRQHILCVQVKARPISHGAKDFGDLASVATLARTEGVTLDNGTLCIPNEVWYVTSYPFAEHKRRQVSGSLQSLDRNGIKFVCGDELSELIRMTLPEVAAGLLKHSGTKAINFINRLSKHSEGRAFGFSLDRQVDEFYVTTAISSHTAFGNAAVLGHLKLEDHCEVREVPLLELVHLDELDKSHSVLSRLVRVRLARHRTDFPAGFPEVECFQDHGNILREVLSSIDRAKDFVGPRVGPNGEEVGYRAAMHEELADVLITFETIYRLSSMCERFTAAARSTLGDCPGILTADTSKVRAALDAIRTVDGIIRVLSETLKIPAAVPPGILNGQNAELLRVRVPDPEHLLALSRVLLVDGTPGCGKTTLLKVLSIRLANLGTPVAYLSCAEVVPEEGIRKLTKLVDKFARTTTEGRMKASETVLVVDGLDEGAFDLSAQIIDEGEQFLNVLVSCRTAFDTRLRPVFPKVTLSVFNDEERDEFFSKWFAQRRDLIEKARGLVRRYPDIAIHSRLPLIATIIVALLENGNEPKTRADVYSMRLEMLLSRWDRLRGVRRLEVDIPEAKRRFLRYLAYRVHSSSGRKRLIGGDELRQAYEDSLGQWGYERQFEVVLRDLIQGSGILVEERPRLYSFGHLTFQEHLAGEYLATQGSVDQILGLFHDDWWHEPLNFYASIKGDITELMDRLLEKGPLGLVAEQLAGMIRCAPYTSPGAVEAFRHERPDLEIGGRR